jgi:hypothetical protein
MLRKTIFERGVMIAVTWRLSSDRTPSTISFLARLKTPA